MDISTLILSYLTGLRSELYFNSLENPKVVNEFILEALLFLFKLGARCVQGYEDSLLTNTYFKSFYNNDNFFFIYNNLEFFGLDLKRFVYETDNNFLFKNYDKIFICLFEPEKSILNNLPNNTYCLVLNNKKYFKMFNYPPLLKYLVIISHTNEFNIDKKYIPLNCKLIKIKCYT